MVTVTFDKYEGSGNDFLILVDPTGTLPYTAQLAVAICDRHRGVGADGLIRLTGDHDTLRMDLRNADGSVAETSGNGLRCAALCALDAGLVAGDTLVLATLGGVAHAEVTTGPRGAREVRVTMGPATVTPVPSPVPGRTAYAVDVGNPHLVLVGGEIDGVDLAGIGPSLEHAVPGGQNVEFVTVDRRDRIRLAVWERGAGITEACGSGSVAAAAAAWSVDLVDDTVVVENPGGPLTVDLFGAARARPETALTGPARRVASIHVELDDVLGEVVR